MVDLGLKPGIVIGDLNSVAPDMLKNGRKYFAYSLSYDQACLHNDTR